MAKTLSEDLRSRVIAAVHSGMSCNAAARRFGIGVATSVRWVRVWRETGAMAAKPKGGDRRSHRIEAFGDFILSAIEAQVDITLAELADLLQREHGASFAPSTIWRFLNRHGISIKKKLRAPASKTGPTSPRAENLGCKRSLISIPSAWSSLMKPARRRKWRVCAAARSGASVAGRQFRMGTGRRQPSSARSVCKA